MTSVCTTFLVHKCSKVRCTFGAARPKFQTFMEDRNTRMVNAFGVITGGRLIGSTTSTIFAGRSNCNFPVNQSKSVYYLLASNFKVIQDKTKNKKKTKH